MKVSLVQWRAVIGIFNFQSLTASTKLVLNLTNNFDSLFYILFVCCRYFESTFTFLLTLFYLLLSSQYHGDIEPNPGPRNIKKNSTLVCHWNPSSLAAHNFSKLTQLKAYNSTYKYDYICLSERYLDSCVPDSLLNIEGYNLVHVNHADNINRGEVCIYYQESIPVRVISL